MTARPQASSPTRLGLGIASLALAAFLLLGFKSPQDAAIAGTSGTGSTGTDSTGTGSNAGGGASSATGSSSGTTGSSGTGSGSSAGTGSSGATAGGTTVDGSIIDTRYGPVEVEITVANGKVTSATAIALPSGGRSGAISEYAAPILSNEALTAQSAQVDIVSGATYTSEGYAQSLQAALDQAGL